MATLVPTDLAVFDDAAVFAACRQKLDANAIPSYLQIVNEIPKTASEKPIERFLLDTFAVDANNVFAVPRG